MSRRTKKKRRPRRAKVTRMPGANNKGAPLPPGARKATKSEVLAVQLWQAREQIAAKDRIIASLKRENGHLSERVVELEAPAAARANEALKAEHGLKDGMTLSQLQDGTWVFLEDAKKKPRRKKKRREPDPDPAPSEDLDDEDDEDDDEDDEDDDEDDLDDGDDDYEDEDETETEDTEATEAAKS